MTPRKREGSFGTEIDGELVLLNGDTGNFHALKGVGLAVWNAIDGLRTVDDICALMADRYAVDRTICAAEVAAFIETLERAQFVDAAA